MSWHQKVGGRAVPAFVVVAVVLVLVMQARIEHLITLLVKAAVALLGLAGGHGLWQEGQIVIGEVRVPWSDDCSTLSYFALLPAVAAYARWREERRMSWWHVVLWPLLLALIINVARVGSIVGCRLLLHPHVETEQVHYLIGFLWLLPAVQIVMPALRRRIIWLESLHVAAVLSLLSPHLSAPGGFVMLAAVAFLAWRRTLSRAESPSRWLWLAWGLLAGWIGFSQMESLWIAWLLLCPWHGIDWRRDWGLAPVLALTSPLAAMHSWSPWLLAAAWLFSLFRVFRGQPCGMTGIVAGAAAREPVAYLAFAFLIPFVALSVAAGVAPSSVPPESLRPSATEKNCYVLHLSGQPPTIRVDWFGSQGGGRHHTLQVCMAYRGEHLSPMSADSPVLANGDVMRREFFLFPDRLIDDFAGYLKHTFWPGSDPGVHLIFSAPVSSMGVDAFDEQCRALAARIREHCRPALTDVQS